MRAVQKTCVVLLVMTAIVTETCVNQAFLKIVEKVMKLCIKSFVRYIATGSNCNDIEALASCVVSCQECCWLSQCSTDIYLLTLRVASFQYYCSVQLWMIDFVSLVILIVQSSNLQLQLVTL